MTCVELVWETQGQVPEDHGYLLYSAVSHRLRSEVHDMEGWALAPLAGDELRLRCPLMLAPVFAAALKGADLRVGGSLLQVDTHPLLVPLEPRSELASTGVTIKAGSLGTSVLSEAEFTAALVSRLEAQGISAIRSGVFTRRGVVFEVGEPREGRIKGAVVRGYTVRFRGLPDAVSLRLQAEGLGGRRRMGWGWFQ